MATSQEVRETVRAPGRSYLTTKRLMDIGIALAGLAVMVLLIVPIAVAIRLDSRGPLFYRARRYGQHGTTIFVRKFRTMEDGAEQRLEEFRALSNTDGPSFKIDGDPRITRVGRLLRKSSLDELPQLIAVLRGDMAIVGPRPVQDSDYTGYEDALRLRNFAKPGLTGLWQVSGRSNLPFQTMMELDQRYVDERSLRLDVMIMLRTIPAVLTGNGAQ